MAWTAPMTAVAGSVFTAPQWNTHIRDNLLESEAGRAQTPSSHLAVDAYNRLAERTASVDVLLVSSETSETSYTDLDSSPGPVVSVQTGEHALVGLTATVLSSGGTAAWMAFAVSGATEIEATDLTGFEFQVSGTTWGGGVVFHRFGLTPGLNTFTAKYRVSTSGKATVNDRRLFVIPF